MRGEKGKGREVERREVEGREAPVDLTNLLSSFFMCSRREGS